MQSDANKAASRRLYEEVFGQGHLEVADEILAPDAISHGPGLQPVVGTDGIKGQALVLRGAFPDLATHLEDQLADGDRVCSRWSATGTHTCELRMPGVVLPPTGKPIAFEEIRIDRFRDGRIVESWFMPDRLTLWQALGLSIPAPAARHTD
jgi:predicted ester cyclase